MGVRIGGLVVLGLVTLGCLAVSAFWLHVVASNSSALVREQANYRAFYWIIACGILGAAWIWLLVKTIRFRSEENP